MSTKALLVGIAGGTGAGKTTLARKVIDSLDADERSKVALISQDWYYKDLSHIPLEKRHHNNFDHPDAVERELLLEHLTRLAAGEAVDAPVYDYKTHTRSADVRRIGPCAACIVEGIHILTFDSIRDALDLKVFVTADDDLRFIRRLTRDIRERGRTPEMVVEQWLSTVRPMHLEFIEPARKFADIVVPWNEENPAAVELIAGRIREAIARSKG